ncbi:MAG: hypothetical protein A2748_02515 [Candidatus Wildermuthbacteria bacterium RIFCSPHIGHO2_01_FULL_45_20]|nr:MAG: hypothetical protein A2748_02515 [Candidatus Wildermuthbacteria bacterium RIFCSPHIGHO2_01_FULL_45_20]
MPPINMEPQIPLTKKDRKELKRQEKLGQRYAFIRGEYEDDCKRGRKHRIRELYHARQEQH